MSDSKSGSKSDLNESNMPLLDDDQTEKAGETPEKEQIEMTEEVAEEKDDSKDTEKGKKKKRKERKKEERTKGKETQRTKLCRNIVSRTQLSRQGWKINQH